MSTVRRTRATLLEQMHAYLEGILRQPAPRSDNDVEPTRLRVLLCDDDTRFILSTAYTQTLLLSFYVVLVDSLEAIESRYLMKHLHAIVLCRPTEKSILALTRELGAGNFKSYQIFFTNMYDSLITIVNADVFDIVESVKEVFLDVVPVADNAANIALVPPLLATSMSPPSPAPSDLLKRENPISFSQWGANEFSRIADGIIATMLMTNRRPVIRYRRGNRVAERLASEVGAKMSKVHAGFPDLKARDAVLLITDRLDDPMTPLMTQWTYEAMIHEIIGFQRVNEVVDPSSAPGSGPDSGGREGETDEERNRRRQQENIHILSSISDSFFAEHRYSDYGQLCVAVGELVEAYKALNSKVDRATASMDDIRNFMVQFPDAKKQSSQVTKHASLVSHIVDEVNLRGLNKVSMLEQDMYVSTSVSEHSKLALELVRNPRTDLDDALRIAMLYHLKYEKNSASITAQLKSELELRGCKRVNLIDKVVEVAGAQYRLHEIYRTSTGALLKAAVGAIAQSGDSQNVLTQHQPLLKKIVNRAYNGTLSEKDYPVQPVQGAPISGPQAVSQRCKDIMVFMVGGATFAEHVWIHQINKGVVDNSVESLMNLGAGVGKAFNALASVAGSDASTSSGAAGGNSGAGDSSGEPQTAKIEANCVLLSTMMLNAKTFIKCMEGL